MSLTVTISSYCSWNRARWSTSRGSCSYPDVRKRYAFSNRSGVLLSPSRPGSSPILMSKSLMSSCIMESSYSTGKGLRYEKGTGQAPLRRRRRGVEKSAHERDRGAGVLPDGGRQRGDGGRAADVRVPDGRGGAAPRGDP